MQIAGQEVLINEISKIFKIFKESNYLIRPHFILTGKSGFDKSLITQIIARLFELSFIEINATQLVKEGTSGNSLSKALSPLLQLGSKPTVVFVDEWDKLFISDNSNNSIAHETTTGIQNEFLKVLESATISIFDDYGTYINVNSKNVLFVFAGTFNNEENITINKLRELGMKTEFLERVGLI